MDVRLCVITVFGVFFVSQNWLTKDEVETSPKNSTLSSSSPIHIQATDDHFHVRGSEYDVVQLSQDTFLDGYAVAIRKDLFLYLLSKFTWENFLEAMLNSFHAHPTSLVPLALFVAGVCLAVYQVYTVCSAVWKMFCLIFCLFRWCCKFSFSKQKQQPPQSAAASPRNRLPKKPSLLQKLFSTLLSKEACESEMDMKKHAFIELLSNPQATNDKEIVDFILSQRNSVSVFQARARQAARIGHGGDKDTQLLGEKFWLEACDRRHRYGVNLAKHFDFWLKSGVEDSFFPWLDVGKGRDLDLPDISREELDSQCVEYCDADSRKKYQVFPRKFESGGEPRLQLKFQPDATLISKKDGKVIFVVAPDDAMYVGVKVKGKFQHSSFLAGGAIRAAGVLHLEENGVVAGITPHSGHYKPQLSEMQRLIQKWRDLGVDSSALKWTKPNKWTGEWPFGADDDHTAQ